MLARMIAPERAPRILVTLMQPSEQVNPATAVLRNALYVDAIARHGAAPIALDAAAPEGAWREACATMDGLLLSGGADLDPARYGQASAGAVAIEPARDACEAAAWAAAESRGVPVLGICRGLQAMNVFAGGTLLQHVAGHQGAYWGEGPALMHGLELVPGTALAELLDEGGPYAPLEVNSYHHQAVPEAALAPAFRASAFAASAAGPLVEAFESVAGPWRMAVQCHPERREFTPEVFERVFAAFVAACRA